MDKEVYEIANHKVLRQLIKERAKQMQGTGMRYSFMNKRQESQTKWETNQTPIRLQQKNTIDPSDTIHVNKSCDLTLDKDVIYEE